jgi:flagellar biosynthetic protein FlhB
VAQTASGVTIQAFLAAVHGKEQSTPYVVLACCVVMPVVSAALCATVASVAVSGGLPLRALRLDMGKVHPMPGLRRMFSARAVVSAARALIGASVAGAALVPPAKDAFSFGVTAVSTQSVASVVLHAAKALLLTACLIGVAFGAIDALVEHISWRRRLRMSLEEMKRDLKQNEGDPHLRVRRRAQHRALIRGSLSRLGEASFVVSNPAHIAIALQYHPPEVTVPRVLIRAIEAGARLVKARARALGIPVIEDVGLARSLLATTRVDEPIPRLCYLAVARIVAGLLHARPRR